jgi:uncharacterized SAM-dependent methyltransferase
MINRFILNGLLHANDILGEKVFKLEDWKVIGEYVYDDEGGRHQAFYSPIRDLRFKDIHFKVGERIQVEQSLKYSTAETAQLWKTSGLNEAGRWSASSEAYSKRSPVYFTLLFLASDHIIRDVQIEAPTFRPYPSGFWIMIA